MFLFDLYNKYKAKREAEKKAREEQAFQEAQEYADLLERIDNFRGFRRVDVWLDNDDLVYGRYLALPGKTMTKAMLLAAEDDFRNSLRHLYWHNFRNSGLSPGPKSVFKKRTEVAKDSKGRALSVTFVGGYKSFSSYSMTISFYPGNAERASINDWSERLPD